jgi:2-polyprenyl-3-methyl-5-hydroxy-6-metoxy-1,4-benzoquinol methylase
MARMTFAWRMLRARLSRARRACPYCGSRFHQFLQRKWILIEARRCAHCGLIFRYPTDYPGAARRYYESEYAEKTVVALPDTAGLGRMVAGRFRGTPFDRAARMQDLRALAPAGGRVLDFGCSWGYCVAQLGWAGFDAVGYEPGRPRAEYGRKQLGLRIEVDWEGLKRQEAGGGFDVVLADHVFEHLDAPAAYLDDWHALLRPRGKLVVYVPNGGGANARCLGVRWGPFIGESHTMALTADWFRRNLPNHGLTAEHLGSTAARPEGTPEGDELVCVAARA